MYSVRKAYEKMIIEGASNAAKGLVASTKKAEKIIDDIVDASGELLQAQYDKDSAEFKKWDELTKKLYETLAELKQLFIKM